MALFMVEQGRVKPAEPREFVDEAALQKLLDDNLEDITGVRLIETQYAIPNGRIDTLGIDEQNIPVVIEYKWGHDPGAIIQGLFYLRWVRENRRTFELLVKERFGKVKVNWSSPSRLLIISKYYSDKEIAVTDMISASVELKRYSFYGNLLSVEDVTLLRPIRPTKPEKATALEKEEKTIGDLVKRASPTLNDLFFRLRGSILELGDDVREKVGGWYCDYRKSSTFTTLTPQSKNDRLLIYLKMGDRKIDDPEKLTSPIPASYGYGKLNTQFEVGKPGQLDYAMQLIKQAYEYVP